MTPKDIVYELDKKVVGQYKAKRAVAVALRNRWCRSQVSEALRNEITPKNVLMIGPTGVGKTEIARRLAKLVNAPFIKIEATKFTEIGYVGRDVDTIIRDLVDIGIKQTRELEFSKVRNIALKFSKNRLLNILIPDVKNIDKFNFKNICEIIGSLKGKNLTFLSNKEKKYIKDKNFFKDIDFNDVDFIFTKQIFKKFLKNGILDNYKIEVELIDHFPQMEIITPSNMEDMTEQIKSIFSSFGNSFRKKKHILKIKDALKLLTEEESNKLINIEELKLNAIANVEQNGIVFLDEIDKIAIHSYSGADVSRLGVQRDLLSLIEGTSVNTRYGAVKTDYILFIASGAFHLTKPSDLIPELQGRFPIKVELDSLSIKDFISILTKTDICLIKQYEALLKADGVNITFTKSGIKQLAKIAFSINQKTENIGARRLYTVMEKLLEEIFFFASDNHSSNFVIDENYVNKKLRVLKVNENLSHHIL